MVQLKVGSPTEEQFGNGQNNKDTVCEQQVLWVEIEQLINITYLLDKPLELTVTKLSQLLFRQ